MRGWENLLIGPSTTLRDALAVIDRTGMQIALVVDARRKLLGTLSDGDIRRALLKGMELSGAVSLAMHTAPVCAQASEDRNAILARMRLRGVHQMPLLDANQLVVGFESYVDYFDITWRPNWVVVMAGGLGSRLGDLTRDVPKPMLRVGSRPLLETIVRGYIAQGFKHFYFAVNYKAEQIEQHFGDGSRFEVEIEYLREQQRMGTAGALSLLPNSPKDPVLVTNADLLTKVDCGSMIDQHCQSGADATMAVREYEMQVPFGVVREQDGRIHAIEEKPMQSYTVSAGIYVLNEAVLKLVPPRTFFDMPALFTAANERGLHARGHRIDGYWLDIGHRPDYERAQLEVDEVFR